MRNRGRFAMQRFSSNPQAVQTQTWPPEHSFVSIEPGNLIITALKQSEDEKDLILRFYEFEGRKTTAQIAIPPGVAELYNANLMEQEGAKSRSTVKGRWSK